MGPPHPNKSDNIGQNRAISGKIGQNRQHLQYHPVLLQCTLVGCTLPRVPDKWPWDPSDANSLVSGKATGTGKTAVINTFWRPSWFHLVFSPAGFGLILVFVVFPFGFCALRAQKPKGRLQKCMFPNVYFFRGSGGLRPLTLANKSDGACKKVPAERITCNCLQKRPL